jgi:hypothetical protein
MIVKVMQDQPLLRFTGELRLKICAGIEAADRSDPDMLKLFASSGWK